MIAGSGDVSVLLDTTVLIDILRGRTEASARLQGLRARGDVPLTTAINVEEIHRGLRSSERQAADQLFDGLRILVIGRPEGERAGAWRRDYAAQGTTLAQADCLIAAAAVAAAVPLATANVKHFPMPELEVRPW